MRTLRVCLLLITASATAWGGWRHDCRVANRACRESAGVSLATTTTTLPMDGFSNDSCDVACILYQGHRWCIADRPNVDLVQCAPPPFVPPCSGLPAE
jgi:hypothetical protein